MQSNAPLQIFFSIGLEGLFFMTTIIFVIFSAITAYHVYTYGTERATATLALLIYLLVSAPLFITMSLALTSI